MSVIRTYACEHCGTEFDSWDKMPECPDCGCVRTQWVPKGGHIAGVSRRGDAEFRALADIFNLTDMNSGEYGRPAKKVNRPESEGWPTRHRSPDTVKNFGAFSAAVDPVGQENNGYHGSECVPVANNINFKTRLGIGNKLGPGKLNAPSIQSQTVIDRQHKP